MGNNQRIRKILKGMRKIQHYNWDLSKIYKTETEFEEEIQYVRELNEKLKALGEDIKGNFKSYLETMTDARRRIYKLRTYSHRKHDEDTRQTHGQKISMTVENLANDYDTITSNFRPSLLSLSKEELEKLIEDYDLENYRKYLDKIFRYKEHTLTAGEEKILGSLSFLQGAPADAYNLLMNSDIEFPFIESAGVKLSHANYVNLIKNKDEEVRKETFIKYYETLKGVDNTISSLQFNNVKGLAAEAKLRNFNSAREMELFKDDVEEIVYDNMIEAVRENLPHLHRYYEIKKKYLGLEKQHMYDIYLPLATEEDKKITYDEGKEIILKGLTPLGDEYLEIIKEAFDNNWIDVYPQPGKRPGAYSSGSYDTEPYILMNYTDNLDSVFTLAHELGHSVHSYYSRKNNDFLYSGYTIFVAEVASTTNELILLDYLMKNATSDGEKIYLIDFYIDNFKGTVFRQTMFAEFEKLIHESVENGQVLTLDDFNKIFYKLNQDYFGEAVISDEDIQLEWAKIPHFYSNFYVYKYATGFSTAVKLAKNILEGDQEALEKYINFLKDGGNNFPLDQLKAAGADISKKETINEAMEVFKGLVDELEELTK